MKITLKDIKKREKGAQLALLIELFDIQVREDGTASGIKIPTWKTLEAKIQELKKDIQS